MLINSFPVEFPLATSRCHLVGRCCTCVRTHVALSRGRAVTAAAAEHSCFRQTKGHIVHAAGTAVKLFTKHLRLF